ALVALLREQRVEFFAQRSGACGRGRKEGAVAVVRGVVFLNEVADVDLILPNAAVEGVPCVHVLFSSCFLAELSFFGKQKRTVSLFCDTAQTVGIYCGTPAPRWFALHLCPSVAGNLSALRIPRRTDAGQLPNRTKFSL